MSDQVSEFLGELAVEGHKEGETTGFTLSSEKAREKLQKFALEHPENYFLLVLAGLHSLGARNFSLRVDADDLEVEGDCRIEREGLKDLWSHVVGGHPTPQAAGLRVLALAMLTSVRFKKAVWTIDGKDDSGPYTFIQSIHRGVLADPVLEKADIPVERFRVSLKRKAVTQVASRFFSQLKNSLFSQTLYEERMLRERLFIGVFDSLVFNEKPLDCRLEASSALAVLRRGDAPEFIGARFHFQDKGEFPMVAVVYPKDGSPESQLGEPATIHWLWHGLKMGSTELGLSYKFARVFVVADDLQTDLGFSSVAETWKRQAAIRQARDSIRSLLEFLVQDFTSSCLADPAHRDGRTEPILIDAIAERIDVRRSRKRLASFNRSLIQCPLFWRSDPDGVYRRATLDELWEKAEKGEPLYCFSDEMEWVEVPAWPDRPPVYRTGAEQYRVLRKLFNGNLFRDAQELAEKLSEIVAVQEQAGESTTVHTVADKVEPWFGTFSWRDCEVSWVLKFPLSTSIKGRLRVLRNGEVLFQDDTLLLPKNLLLYGELPLLPDYTGRLLEEYRDDFFLPAFSSLVEVLAQQDETGPVEIQVSAILWRLLDGKITVWEGCSEIYEAQWLVVGEPDAPLRLQSPAEVFSNKRTCFYYCTPEALADNLEQAHSVATFVLPSELEKALSENLEAPVHSVRGLELLRARPPYEFDRESYHVIEFERERVKEWDERLRNVGVGIPRSKKIPASARDITLHQTLHGHSLQVRSVASPFSPLTVCLDWEKGMPDSRGLHFAEKDQTDMGRELAKAVAFQAALVLFSHAGLPELLGFSSPTVENFWLELWLRGEELSGQKLFPRSDGSRVSYTEVVNSAQPILYFKNLNEYEEFSQEHVLWIPSALCQDILELHPELSWEEAGSELSPPEETTSQSTVALLPVKSSVPNEPAVAQTKNPEFVYQEEERVESDEPRSDIAAEVVDHSPIETEKSTEIAEPAKPEVLDPPATIPVSPVEVVQEMIILARSLGAIPFRQEFIAFLSGLSSDSEQKSPLSLVQGQIVLGGEKTMTRDCRFMVLSALYSIFNRHREDVLDLHEREFHALLLEQSLA